MKIALIGPVYPYRGGIAHHTALLERGLTARQNDVRVISFKRQYPRWLYPGISDRDPSRAPIQTKADYILDPLYPWTWRTAQKSLSEFSPNLVVIQWWTTFWAFAFASLSAFCRKQGFPVAYILHNVLPHEQRPWDATLARAALRQASTIIAQNPNEAQRLHDLLPAVDIRNCEMPLYSGFSATVISKTEAREKLGINPEEQVLLFFGIVRPYKGLHVLLDALAQLKQRGQQPYLLVAGEFWDEPDGYMAAIRRLDLGGQVRIDNRYIPNEEVDVYLSAADILVAPYLAGTQSAAVALALGRSLPVILTERIAAGIPPDYRALAHTVPANDAAALAEAVRRALQEKPPVGLPVPDPQADWMRMVRLLESLAHREPLDGGQ